MFDAGCRRRGAHSALNVEHRALTSVTRDRIAWLPWSADAFARAARERKPVLLSITASWCRACHDMDRTTYARRARRLADSGRLRSCPRRHRSPARHQRALQPGGWPTTAFLTAAGDLLGGGTFVTADHMPGNSSAGARSRPHARRRDRTGPGGDRHVRRRRRRETQPSLDSLVDLVFASFDDEHGGFGVTPKFPLTAPLHLALALYTTHGDVWSRQIVERTLDAIRDGGLHDRERGGFFRYATTREWQLPHVEKLLETNTALLHVYAEAAHAFNDDSYRGTARDLATYIQESLIGAAGGYRGSESDTVVYADTSAAASAALLAASKTLGDPDLGREAIEQLERVLLASYRPGKGISHCNDGAFPCRDC